MPDTPGATGVVTATVSEDPALPLGLPLPAGWTAVSIAALCADLAHHLYDDDVILQKHGITPEQLRSLEPNKLFQQTLKIAADEWHSIKSIQQRLALEAAVTLEGAMPTIGARMKNGNEALSGVVEAGKLLAKMSGVGEQKQVTAPGEKFTIQINIGDTALKYEKNRTAGSLVEIQSLPEGPSARSPVSLLDGGKGNQPALPSLPEGDCPIPTVE